ncbi:RluA family pseudouridine synthase [Bacillus sp. REN10]|uniref:RluA family pseudouridine synthase n=1 Tax=Bacillus sp. REN10 TaxID=2782541 RepID=UPI00193B4358|nr:RluA family pseudouridine synthase [Bacillus sp. REN10]
MYITNRKGSLFEVIIPKEWDGKTVDAILRNVWKLPKKMIHTWRMNQEVLVNNAKANWHLPLAQGMRLQVPFFAKTEQSVTATKMKIDILLEDDHMLVVNKPAAMKTHPNEEAETDTLLNAVAFHLQSAGEECDVRHVHRLDVGTSGVILFAKHPAAYAVLSRLLEERHIKRTYRAVVHGLLSRPSGTINKPIGKDRHHPTRKRVSPSGQTAITHYQVISSDPKRNVSLVQCQLDTGRTHQIRVHFSAIGHPLVGDRLYGGKPLVHRQALHAHAINIPHPFTGERIYCEAETPNDLIHLFEFHH